MPLQGHRGTLRRARISTRCRAVTRRALRRAERRVVVRRHQQRQRGRIGRAAGAAVAQHRDAAMRHDSAAHVAQAGGGAAQPVADVVQLVAHLCRVQTAVELRSKFQRQWDQPRGHCSLWLHKWVSSCRKGQAPWSQSTACGCSRAADASEVQRRGMGVQHDAHGAPLPCKPALSNPSVAAEGPPGWRDGTAPACHERRPHHVT